MTDNLLLPGDSYLVYLSVAEVKATSKKAWLVASSDNAIKELIYKAELTVDRYIQSYWTKYVSTQPFIFPALVNDVSFLPNDLKIATLYIVENLYEAWDTITWDTKWTWNLTQESAWDYLVKYQEVKNTNLNIEKIPQEAKAILKKYRKIFLKDIL
jgi:hypothetical protein